MRWVTTLAVCALLPAAAHGQERVTLPRNEASIAVGWTGTAFGAADEYDRWGSSFLAGVSAARYWTDHLKTEVEVGWFSPVHKDTYEFISVPGGTGYVRGEYRFRNIRTSLAQTYQFGRNAWVHPYLGAGADVSVLHIEEFRPAQSVPFNSGRGTELRTIPSLREDDTDTRVLPFVKGGLKLYFNDRGFVTTELKFVLHSGVEQVLWKTGLGIDF